VSTGKDDLAEALGIGSAEVVSYDAWIVLPRGRRHILAGPEGSRRVVYLRLPDPPPVAALRQILQEASGAPEDMNAARAQREVVQDLAAAALAEFDGTAGA